MRDPAGGIRDLIMIYAAEIHCPRSPRGATAGWVSVGVARSADGAYASFMTPRRAPGHIGLSGTAPFLRGDPIGPRELAARTFTITLP